MNDSLVSVWQGMRERNRCAKLDLLFRAMRSRSYHTLYIMIFSSEPAGQTTFEPDFLMYILKILCA